MVSRISICCIDDVEVGGSDIVFLSWSSTTPSLSSLLSFSFGVTTKRALPFQRPITPERLANDASDLASFVHNESESSSFVIIPWRETVGGVVEAPIHRRGMAFVRSGTIVVVVVAAMGCGGCCRRWCGCCCRCEWWFLWHCCGYGWERG